MKYNVIVKDVLPSQMSYSGNLKIDGQDSVADITAGVNIGNLEPYQSKTITFEALLASKEKFYYGLTGLINTASASNPEKIVTDTAKVTVIKTAVAGAITEVPTGILSTAKISFYISVFIVWLITYLLLLRFYVGEKIIFPSPKDLIFDIKERAINFLLGIKRSPQEKSKERLYRLVREIKRQEEMLG